MEKIRRKVFTIIEASDGTSKASTIYDGCMLLVIVISLIPLTSKASNTAFSVIDVVAAIVFSADYALRLLTADFKLERGWPSFLMYPFSPMAVIDLLAILPTFLPVFSGLRLLKIFRLFRTFRVFRVFKAFRYSKSLVIILDVIKSQKTPLLAVCSLAAGYVIISALVVFNVEPDTFGTFFDAMYWATISLTTVGYGDIYPVTTAGRIITMVSSFVGIAIVALPSGIITAGYMERISKSEKS